MTKWIVALLGVALLAGGTARAQMHDHGGHAKDGECKEPTLACATKVTPAIAADGKLWLAFAAGGRVLVTRSPDQGLTFAAPVAVTPAPMQLDWGPDARPKIAVDAAGRVHVAFAIFKDKAFNGQVFLSRSTDGGATFEAPRPITAVQESQRFEALALDADGQVFAAWLDKRMRVPARARGEKYPGAALAFAWIGDGGAKVSDTILAKDETCECCRFVIGFAGPGRPVVMFRNIFDKTTRDHAVITFADRNTPGPIRRVSVDDWKTDACPHHGPGLSVAGDAAYHVVWFTGGSVRKGLFYARSTDAGATFSEPMPFGRAGRQPQHPSVLAVGSRIWIAWKEFDGNTSSVEAISSADQGLTWGKPRALATTTDSSDHPLLIAREGQAFLSWQTAVDGYRFIGLEAP